MLNVVMRYFRALGKIWFVITSWLPDFSQPNLFVPRCFVFYGVFNPDLNPNSNPNPTLTLKPNILTQTLNRGT